MTDNYRSLTGETDTEDSIKRKRWAARTSDKTDAKARSLNDKGGVGKFIQTKDDYLDSVSQDQENGGAIPVWKVADFTAFISADIQKAMNDIKSGADSVIAYGKLVSSVGKILVAITKANASVVEALINALRDEIKSILDGLLAVGGVYVLYIPFDVANAGGIDYYKKTFLDSLEDLNDRRRPLLSKTTTAHAVFMAAGASSPGSLSPALSALADFLFPESRRAPQAGDLSTLMPGPSEFNVLPIFAPRLKSPVKQDDLYKFANDAQADATSTLRLIEGWASFTEKSARLLGDCTWKMPDALGFELTLVTDTEANVGTYTVRNFHENHLGSGTIEYIMEEVIASHYAIVRSTSSVEVNSITPYHPAVLKALSKGDDVGPNEEGLGEETKIFAGRLVPGFHFYQDDELTPPSEASIKATLNGVEIPSGPVSSKSNLSLYYYKMLIAGVRRKYRLKYEYRGGNSYDVYGSSSSADPDDRSTFYQKDKIKTVSVEDIGLLFAQDIFNVADLKDSVLRRNVQPIYDKPVVPTTKQKTDWILSEFSGTVSVTNTTVVSPVSASSPNWYSLQIKDLLPPLVALIEQAKRFIDTVADSLIESLNVIVALVEAIVAEVEFYVQWITKLMELIKALLFPPMAGVHVLTVETNRGIEGLKEQFNKSFSKSPASATGENDYPDEYIKHGNRVPVGTKFLDVGGQKYKDLLPANNKAKEKRETDGTYSAQMATPAESQQHSADFFLELKQTLFGSKDDRGRRRGEPSDEDMRRLGIPIYDKHHFTGGFVFIFEEVGAFTAFTRLFNLEAFYNKEINKAKKQLIGAQAFSQIKWPSLNNLPSLVPSRTSALKKRLDTLEKRGDNDALLNDLANSTATGDGSEIVGDSGNETVLLDDGPYTVTVPAILSFVTNGLPTSVIITGNGTSSQTMSAKDLAAKINAAYKKMLEAYCAQNKLSAAACAELLKAAGLLAVVAGDTLGLVTPPGIYGDKTKSLKVLGAAKDLAPRFRTKDSFTGLDFDTELETFETAFPTKAGDLLLEMEGFGLPTPDMFRAAPAILELEPFVADPSVQDFAPDRCRLLIELDSLGPQSVDVTGNLGGNPNDSAPEFFVDGVAGADLEFPLAVDTTNNKFKFSITGDFVLLENVAASVKNFVELTAGIHFRNSGVRNGDEIILRYDEGGPDEFDFSTTVADVDYQFATGTTIRLKANFTYQDSSLKILKIVKADTPPALRNTLVPNYESEVTVSEGVFADLSEFMQAMNSALDSAGFGPNTVELSVIDTSPLQDETKGKLKVTLGSWGIGTTTSMTMQSAGYVGAPAQIVTPDISAHFPYTVGPDNNKFRFELFGHETIAAGFQVITLTQQVYASVADFAGEVETQLVAAGYPDMAALDDAGSLVIYIDSAAAARHYSYSEKVGIRIKALDNMDTETVFSSFTDGTSKPPHDLVTPSITFPFKVRVGYQSKFSAAVVPTVGTRPAGITTCEIAPGDYGSAAALAVAVQDALTKKGMISGDAGFIKVDAEGADKLRFSLKPEASYLGTSATVALFNGRGSPAALGAPLFATAEMRDYDYAKIFTWLTNNPAQFPKPGFPEPAPLAFLASNYLATSGPTVYNGLWTVTAANNKFEIKLETPLGSYPVGFQLVTVAPATYATFAALVAAIQTAIDGIYGAGIIAVSDSDVGFTVQDALVFTTAHASLKGEFTAIYTQQYGNVPFISYGGQTVGALEQSAAGTGDLYFMEGLGMADTLVGGVWDLFTALGIMTGVTAVDSLGVKYRQGVGTSDYNLLRILGMEAVSAIGSFKVPYTLAQIITALHGFFTGLDQTYSAAFRRSVDQVRLRVKGKTRGSGGKIKVVAAAGDGTDAPRVESAQVAELVFGFSERDSDIAIIGVGRAVTTKAPVVVCEYHPELEVVYETQALTVVSEKDDYIVEVEIEPEQGMIVELETL